ncbi:bifunctional metallophosphatase/5'-nucleotidase [Niallia nealsonii]|uniref:Bifunctional metallophosphatase/5'-nucleotidase n=1 Tax=Niallia nealsonii TaxID=115979 RepID=A0A2N0Z117_9BACI|nr:bifunctional UDP-sugar hydrolase/5'-nucleotidase [Niallia nealsonii]PKG23212.1 bifunctional metallophosphatase/5'-nucleotidase [Niallia nealsonii]
MAYIKITILLTSDVHGNIYPLNYGDNKPAPLGLAKVAELIEKERMKSDHIVVIDNGDLIQGTPLTYHYVHFLGEKKNPMIQALNTLQYDAAVIGNHEFNYGLPVLKNAVKESKFPWLCANILDKKTGHPFLGTPYIIKNVGPFKLAVLGITTHYIPNWENPNHIEGLEFRDALLSAKEWTAKIKEEEQPDIMIISYHGGFERDILTGEPTEALTGENQGYQICEEIENLDVLLTGHQHRMLTGSVHETEIIQASNNGSVLGKVTLVLSEEGKIIEKHSELLSAADAAPDKRVMTFAAEYESSTQKWLDMPMGFIDGDMEVHDPLEIRLKDSSLIEFINTIQMDAAKVKISNTALFNNDSPGFKSNVTMRDIVSNYIYPNTLKVLALTGQDIREALEQTAKYFTLNEQGNPVVSEAFLYPKPQHYNYDMWEGVEYILDISKPVGERVVKLDFEGKEIEEQNTYEVVMNNYRAGGGGNYFMFQNKPVIREVQFDMSELIASYILKRKTVKATCNLNWKVVW